MATDRLKWRIGIAVNPTYELKTQSEKSIIRSHSLKIVFFFFLQISNLILDIVRI